VEGQTPPQILLVRVSDEGPGIANLSSILAGQYRSTTGMGHRHHGHASPDGRRSTSSRRRPRHHGLAAEAPAARHAAGHAGQRRQRWWTRWRASAPTIRSRRWCSKTRSCCRPLDELHRRQKELEELNSELEDTNRGVVALYAELD
jgi:hypothetical protein